MLERRGIIVHPEELDNKWLDDIEKAGINVLGLHPVGGWRANLTLAAAVERHQTPEFQALLKRAKEMGVTVEYEAHALRYLMPKELFEEHPDWFRMNDKGERVSDHNMCAMNEEALEYLADSTEKLTRTLDTGSDRFFWWADDVEGGAVCHCGKCRDLSPSDQLMKITNAMLKGVKRVKPEGKIAFLAYHDALVPPTKVAADEGVFLEYAPIGRDSHRPMNDAGCEKNVGEGHALKELIAFFGKENSQVLEYWMDNSRFSNWTKPPKAMPLDEAVMKEDVAYYRGLGFESITSFGCYLGPDYRELHGQPPVQPYGDILKSVE